MGADQQERGGLPGDGLDEPPVAAEHRLPAVALPHVRSPALPQSSAQVRLPHEQVEGKGELVGGLAVDEGALKEGFGALSGESES